MLLFKNSTNPVTHPQFVWNARERKWVIRVRGNFHDIFHRFTMNAEWASSRSMDKQGIEFGGFYSFRLQNILSKTRRIDNILIVNGEHDNSEQTFPMHALPASALRTENGPTMEMEILEQIKPITAKTTKFLFKNLKNFIC